MSLSSIVNVEITRLTQSVSQAGFGTLMILGTNKRFNNRIKYYENMSGVAEDFRPYDKEYIAAQDVFAQSPAPSLLAIGRRTANQAMVRVITSMNNQSYTARINGVDSTISSTPVGQNSTVVLSADLVTSNSIAVTVNSVVLTPVVFATSHLVTMNCIAAAIAAQPNIESATVGGLNNRTIFVVADPNQDAVVNSFVVTLGASQAVATITVFDQPVTNINIAASLAAAINASSLGVTADASAGDGTFTIDADVPGVPYTLDVSTNITNPNQAIVTVTQVEPNQTYTVEINKVKSVYTAPNDVESAEEIAGALIDLININQTSVSADFDSIAQETTITLSANLVTLNSIAITLNGNVLTPVVFATSHLATMQAIASLLEAQPGIQSATIFGPTNRGIQLRGLPDSNAIVSSFVVTLGASQATATLTDEIQPSGSIIISNNVASGTFTINVTANILSLQKGLLVEDLVASDAIEDDLDAVVDSNNDWYGLALTSRAVQDVLSASTWTQSKIKLFGTASSDISIIDESSNDDTTSIAYQLATLGNNSRTFLMYHQDADDDYPECAWFGRCLPLEPGSETWKFKQLSSISYSKLSTTQSINAETKSVNTYQFVGGFGITQEGVVVNGEFIDIIRGVDWLTARIQEFVFFVLVNNNKVPYTDTGITMIESEVRRALDLGVSNNFLAADPQYTVTVPRAATVPTIDKSNRILRNVNFQATLAGAIHFVEIRGVVSV